MKKLLIITALIAMNLQALLANKPCDCELFPNSTTRMTYGYSVADGGDCCEDEAGPIGTWLQETWDPEHGTWVPVDGGVTTGSGAQSNCCTPS